MPTIFDDNTKKTIAYTYDIFSAAKVGYAISSRFSLERAQQNFNKIEVDQGIVLTPELYSLHESHKQRPLTSFLRSIIALIYNIPISLCEEPWLEKRKELLSNGDNKARIKLIDADVKYSKSIINDAFWSEIRFFAENNVKIKRALFRYEKLDFRPYNITESMMKFILRYQMSTLLDKITNFEFEISKKVLPKQLWESVHLDREDLHTWAESQASIAEYLDNNNAIESNWQVEHEERKTSVYEEGISCS